MVAFYASDADVEQVQRLVRWAPEPLPKTSRLRPKPYSPPTHLTKDAVACPCFRCPQRSSCEVECLLYLEYVAAPG